MFRRLIWFAFGAAAGGAAVYYICRNKFAEQSQNDINAMKEYYEKKYSTEKDGLTVNVTCDKETFEYAKNIAEKADSEMHITKDEVDGRVEAKEIIKHTGYSSYSAKLKGKTPMDYQSSIHAKAEYEEDDDEDEEQDYPSETTISPSEGVCEVPYSISPMQFANENLYFDKITITYYPRENTFVDDADDIIDDPRALVGADILDHIGEYESDTAYIRNERMSIDYEVIVDNSPCPFVME